MYREEVLKAKYKGTPLIVTQLSVRIIYNGKGRQRSKIKSPGDIYKRTSHIRDLTILNIMTGGQTLKSLRLGS